MSRPGRLALETRKAIRAAVAGTERKRKSRGLTISAAATGGTAGTGVITGAMTATRTEVRVDETASRVITAVADNDLRLRQKG